MTPSYWLFANVTHFLFISLAYNCCYSMLSTFCLIFHRWPMSCPLSALCPLTTHVKGHLTHFPCRIIDNCYCYIGFVMDFPPFFDLYVTILAHNNWNDGIIV